MFSFKYKVKLIPVAFLLFALLLLAGFLVFPSCPYEVSDQTYKCTTKDDKLIAINITIENGKVTGYGYHLSGTNEEKYFNIVGEIDCETGRFEIYENLVIEETFFGQMRGRMSKTKMNLISVWIDQYSLDETPINLVATTKTPEEVLDTESPSRTRENMREWVKEKKEKAFGFIEGFLPQK